MSTVSMLTSCVTRSLAAASRPALLLAATLLVACGSENLIPPPHQDQADLYWDLELNHHAVVLDTVKPYDTLQLVATPRNFRDEPLAGLSGVTYTSTDPDHVVVTGDGLLIATKPTVVPVEVVATLTAQHVKHTDTVVVSVVDDPAPPVLAALSIHPVPPDSAKVAPAFPLNITGTLHPRAVTAAGDSIPVWPVHSLGYLPVDFRSSDSTVAVIGRNVPELIGARVGSLTVYASTTAFGVTKVDTLPYSIGWPMFGMVLIGPNGTDGALGIHGTDIKIGTGGAVMWGLAVPADFSDTVDVTFADTDVPNIMAVRPVVDRLAAFNSFAPWWFCSFDCDNGGSFFLSNGGGFFLSGSQQRVGRYFPVPGTYVFHSTRHGFSGRITVVDER